MTKEQQNALLLRDISSRLVHNVCVLYRGAVFKVAAVFPSKLCPVILHIPDEDKFLPVFVDEVKPFLRSTTSMTNVESIEYSSLDLAYKKLDWLTANHFDFRGLIDLNIAVRVTEHNNPYKPFQPSCLF